MPTRLASTVILVYLYAQLGRGGLAAWLSTDNAVGLLMVQVSAEPNVAILPPDLTTWHFRARSRVNGTMIRLGGYGVPVASDDPNDIARAHREFGYRAAYCPAVELHDRERIDAIARAFAREDVEIAEVAAWRNVSPPDPVQRKAAREYVAERLALAEEVGARCAITYIGSMGPNLDFQPDSEDLSQVAFNALAECEREIKPHPDNLSQVGFDTFVECAREIIESVKPKRAKLCFEMMQWELPDSPEILLELIKAIDRPAFAAHMDPTNLIVSPRLYYNNGDLIRRCFELVGPWIISAHAKDITLRSILSLHLDEVMPGQGALDYRTYLSELDGRGIPLLLEHLDDTQYPVARDHIKSVGKSLNIDI